MIKNAYFIILAALITSSVNAQIARLKIGDKVPDTFWDQEHTFDSIGATSKSTLTPHKGKLIILDFWATYCAACISGIPKIDSLGKKFAERIAIIPVTVQQPKEIDKFLSKLNTTRGYTIKNTIVSDTILKQYFPFLYLPHYVWIDPDGKIVAITEPTELTERNVLKILDNRASENIAKEKFDGDPVRYDMNYPMLGNNSGDTSRVLWHSLLTGYQEGMPMGYSVKRMGKLGRLTVRNYSIPMLYSVGFQEKGISLIYSQNVLAVADSTKVFEGGRVATDLGNWMRAGNGYCYEMIFPWDKIDSARTMMRNDLMRYFPEYRAKLIWQDTKCLVLRKTGGKQAYISKGGKRAVVNDQFSFSVKNTSMYGFLFQLYMLHLSPLDMELLNESGYSGSVDISLTGDLAKLKVINDQLSKYGLEIVEGVRKRQRLYFADKSAKVQILKTK